MTEQQYRSFNNFGWYERDIHGRLLRDQIEGLEFTFVHRLDQAISDAKAHFGRKNGQFKIYDFMLDEHSPDGYHPRGRAGDGAFRGLNLFEAYIVFDRWLFGGIGIYLDTKPDKIVHVDDRRQYRNSRWVRREGVYFYEPTVLAGELKKELKRAA